MKVLIEISARHIHLSQKDLKILFGKEGALTQKKTLSQPGEFLCNERVTLIGPKKSIENMAIIGPCRNKTQVELSITDARSVGINAPIRISGDLDQSSGCKLVGPIGEIELSEGVIVVKRHLHMKTIHAEELGLKDGDVVMVKIESPERTTIFDNVCVRVDSNFELVMHIDTDEANAAGCIEETYGEIILKKD